MAFIKISKKAIYIHLSTKKCSMMSIKMRKMMTQ